MTSVIPSGPVRERPRVFRVARAVLLIVAVFSVLTALLQTWTVTTGRTLLVFGGADGRLPLRSLPQLLQAEPREGTAPTLADAALSLRLLGALPSLLQAVTIVLAAVFLLRVLRGIAAGRPFDPFVLANWRRLSLALLIGGVAQGLADTAAGLYLSSGIGLLFAAGRVTDEQRDAFLGGDYQAIGTNLPQWPVPVLLAGVVALALTAAFRAGAKLERDVDGVV
ncbi:hypothetical protein C5D09_15135 [Rathayibacter sp. AY1C9]|uniref:hypothetical protein n=1 Tax=Rathayibacter sp. AY1C9 TaxID=2080541 RepID=UPI000CE875FE|nr:hypothetical protein [Rathayibacter sp. AY1C9]PPH43116.1 hypothetical protein C5D09_15135 [Rathayibacter sp. AY1C9]